MPDFDFTLVPGKPIMFDFRNWLRDGEHIKDRRITFTPNRLVLNRIIQRRGMVQAWPSRGTVGVIYHALCVARTNLGQRLELGGRFRWMPQGFEEET